MSQTRMSFVYSWFLPVKVNYCLYILKSMQLALNEGLIKLYYIFSV